MAKRGRGRPGPKKAIVSRKTRDRASSAQRMHETSLHPNRAGRDADISSSKMKREMKKSEPEVKVKTSRKRGKPEAEVKTSKGRSKPEPKARVKTLSRVRVEPGPEKRKMFEWIRPKARKAKAEPEAKPKVMVKLKAKKPKSEPEAKAKTRRGRVKPKVKIRVSKPSHPGTGKPAVRPTSGFVTVFDRIYRIVRERKKAGISRISRELGIGKSRVEFLAGILARYGLIELEYPAIGGTRLKLKESREAKKPEEEKGRLLEKYTVVTEDVPMPVEIRRVEGEPVPFYVIKPPIIGPGTKIFMDYILDTIVKEMKVAIEETIDPKRILHVRERFHARALKEMGKVLGKSGEQNNVLACLLMHRMHGLGKLEPILADDFLEELVINNSNVPVVVYHKKHGWLTSNVRINTEEDIYNLASEIGRKVQREITTLNPMMDAHLLTGDRVAASLFPISTLGNTITIRKFSRTPWTIPALIENKTISTEISAFLWQALQYELSILVAGGTASGKTSCLNSLCAMVPPTQRIISIEDTREIFLPSYLHWNWVPLTTRNPNPEGQGEVSMLDLMVSSLRMRPDRIIVGEVRRKKQAETMFEAMHTGHSVYTTMHADTGEQVRRRLLEPPIEIPKSELEALQLILIQYRDRRKNLRRTLELVEILTGAEEEVQLNYLYRWHPRKDIFEKVNDSIRVVEDLNLHTGMTVNEITEDLKEKEKILQWMVKQKIFEIENVGLVMKHYYRDPSSVISAASQNKKLKDIKA